MFSRWVTYIYIKCCIVDELKRLLTFNYVIHSSETRFSEVFHKPKGNTTWFAINSFSFSDTKLWNNIILNYYIKKSISQNLNLELKTNFLNTDFLLITYCFWFCASMAVSNVVFNTWNNCAFEKAEIKFTMAPTFITLQY